METDNSGLDGVSPHLKRRQRTVVFSRHGEIRRDKEWEGTFKTTNAINALNAFYAINAFYAFYALQESVDG